MHGYFPISIDPMWLGRVHIWLWQNMDIDEIYLRSKAGATTQWQKNKNGREGSGTIKKEE